MENSVTTPEVVTRAILFVFDSVTQRFPSGPAAIPCGQLSEVVSEYSVMDPEGVIRPTVLPLLSVNHRLPSGPLVRRAPFAFSHQAAQEPEEA
jgi:hypothetical protein